ncbi:TPA: NAD(P)H-dependent flavin oxidoreductase [Vibrio parahaemolyticus]
MKNNAFNALLGTELPIIQAPMAGVQDSQMAIAVSNVGGLGSLPCGMLNKDAIVKELQLIKQATNRPFNLNFFCHEMPEYDANKHEEWQKTLQPYFAEVGATVQAQPNAPTRMPFNHDIADAIEPFAPPVISFHFGLPADDLLARIRGWGGKILSTATTVDEALWLEAKGVDGIIAQGLMALLPQIVKRVNLPVIAAGGIADKSGVEAALKLGASAVQVGSAYLLCDEAKTSSLHRYAIASERAQHTAVTNVFSGRPARGIVNRAMSELGYICESAPKFPYASIEMTQLRALMEKQNRDEFTPLWCGQNSSGCKEVSAAEMTLSLVEGIDLN